MSQQQQRFHAPRATETMPPLTMPDAATGQEHAERFARTAEALIDRILSSDSQRYLKATRQPGGE